MQGKTINGFTLQRLLGVGGMAEVWYAENEIGMKAAVKILSEKLSHDDQMQERFLNEAKVMVQLDHPNIRKVHGFGEIDNRPAIIMEYLDGSDLKARMKSGQRFTQEELAKWWNQLVDALNYTHAQNIVHRDIKPSNIFIDQKGNAKLLDFGIAKVADTTSGTLTGSTLGTRIYMSPEQVKDPKRVGTASDVYSLAVSFVHLLTGKAPYDSTTSSDYDIQESIVRKPVDLSKVPAEWQSFLKPYLEKDPAKRPALKCFEVDSFSGESVASSSGGFANRPEGNGDLQSLTDDEGTMVSNDSSPKSAPEETHSIGNRHSRLDPLSHESKDKPKSKKGLWIGLGIVAVVILMGVVLLSPDADNQTFQSCYTVDDYRSYVNEFGVNAKHYSEAKKFIDCFVTDSIEQITRAQEEKEEDEAYAKCTTIVACDNYLKDYPQGRYVDSVKVKRSELEMRTFYIKGVPFVMKYVNGGTFDMGATREQAGDANSDEMPVHSVTVSSYYMGETEVTQALWKAVMGENPSNWKGNNLPVEQVDWTWANKFIDKLNSMTGENFRLPTEAEWEFAARGGNKSLGFKYSGSNTLSEVAWFKMGVGDQTHPVKLKKPNELGLYDMSGNVWEWCYDGYGKYDGSSQVNPRGHESKWHVVRGGCTEPFSKGCRVSLRDYSANSGYTYIGFRLALPQ